MKEGPAEAFAVCKMSRKDDERGRGDGTVSAVVGLLSI